MEYDIAFVGNTYGDHPLYAERRRLLALLSERYKVRVEQGVYFRNMADVYASARVVFNRSACGDLNMRVFEAMCAGRPLVTDAVPGLLDLFEDCKHLFVYRNDDELSRIATPLNEFTWCERDDGDCENCACYCDCPESADGILLMELGWIGEAGREEVLAHHTYLHRVQTILQAVGL